MGWNEDASSKLRDVFPNQMRANSQAMDLNVRGGSTPSFAVNSSHDCVSSFNEEEYAEILPRVQRVNKSPEKHIAAIPMKNTNCETIARSDLY